MESAPSTLATSPVLIGIRRALPRSQAAPRGWVVFAAAVEVEEVVPVIHHTWRTGRKMTHTLIFQAWCNKCMAAMMMQLRILLLLLNSSQIRIPMLVNGADEDDGTVVLGRELKPVYCTDSCWLNIFSICRGSCSGSKNIVPELGSARNDTRLVFPRIYTRQRKIVWTRRARLHVECTQRRLA